MVEVKLHLNEKNHGAFEITENGEKLGEMIVAVSDLNLTVFHTEVSPKAEGKGYAKKMLNEMINYARANNLKIIPKCTYVQAQFKKHPQEYADLWEKGMDSEMK